MTTCPRCGRIADDEFVCADCGAFLAGEDTEPATAVSVGRVAALVLVVCLLGAGGAALLLRGGGGGGHRDDLSIPFASSPVELSSAPLGGTGSGQTRGQLTGPTTSASVSGSATRTRTPSPTASTSAHRSRSASPSTQPLSTRPAPTPHPTTSHSTSKPPSSTAVGPPPPTPTVHLSEGALALCGPHCFPLVVTLSNFSAGSHTVNCFSGHDGKFGSYTTSSTTSSECTYRRPNDTVYVVVDGHRSNAIIW